MVINPIVIDDSGSRSDIFSSNLSDRVVHMVGPITDEMAASVVAQLLHLAKESDDDISLYINSPGGAVTAGFSIYDTMQFIKPRVSTVCVGQAASMAAVILSGGEKGMRYALPNSEVMIHQPSGGAEGQAQDIIISADHIKRTRQRLNEILSENSSQKIEIVEKDTARDFWMLAKEAKEYGLVDQVLTSQQEQNGCRSGL